MVSRTRLLNDESNNITLAKNMQVLQGLETTKLFIFISYFNNVDAVIISRDKVSILGRVKRANKMFIVDNYHNNLSVYASSGSEKDSNLVK